MPAFKLNTYVHTYFHGNFYKSFNAKRIIIIIIINCIYLFIYFLIMTIGNLKSGELRLERKTYILYEFWADAWHYKLQLV